MFSEEPASYTWNARNRATQAKDAGTMKALLLSKYRHLEIVDVPAPTPAPDQVLIQVAACGICGSDVHRYDGSSGRHIPPLVMGHEAAGIATVLGSGSKEWAGATG
jgi:L-iditol 2-dehydrogenase